MKAVIVVAIVIAANIGLLFGGQARLVWSGTTSDNWKRECAYYYPFNLVVVVLPLSQSCPGWSSPA